MYLSTCAKFTSPKLTHPSRTGRLRGGATGSCSSVEILSHKKIKLGKRGFHQYNYELPHLLGAEQETIHYPSKQNSVK